MEGTAYLKLLFIWLAMVATHMLLNTCLSIMQILSKKMWVVEQRYIMQHVQQMLNN